MGVYRILGFVLLALAIVGVVLPLLPTTPLVIAAAACFARSSEKWHRWLLANPTFGPMIGRWEEQRCLSRRVKAIALASMLGVGGFSIIQMVDVPGLRIAGAVLLAVGALVVLRLPTCPDSPESGKDEDA